MLLGCGVHNNRRGRHRGCKLGLGGVVCSSVISWARSRVKSWGTGNLVLLGTHIGGAVLRERLSMYVVSRGLLVRKTYLLLWDHHHLGTSLEHMRGVCPVRRGDRSGGRTLLDTGRVCR